jgi:transcriptional regulator with XRE-family HTH domain
MTLNEKLRFVRIGAGFSQSKLGTMIGTKKSYISDIECGKFISETSARIWANACGYEIEIDYKFTKIGL